VLEQPVRLSDHVRVRRRASNAADRRGQNVATETGRRLRRLLRFRDAGHGNEGGEHERGDRWNRAAIHGRNLYHSASTNLGLYTAVPADGSRRGANGDG